MDLAQIIRGHVASCNAGVINGIYGRLHVISKYLWVFAEIINYISADMAFADIEWNIKTCAGHILEDFWWYILVCIANIFVDLAQIIRERVALCNVGVINDICGRFAEILQHVTR